MGKPIYLVLIVAASSAAATYGGMRSTIKAAKLEAMEMKAVSMERERHFLGSTLYTNYLAVGKQYLSGSMKLIAATVIRDEGLTQAIERSLLGMSFSGAILITYQAEYSFGFDLRSDQYDIHAVPAGIEVQVRRPTLVATPAVSNLKHKVLSGSLLTDEQAAALKLYELAAARVKAQGIEIASEPAVMALCEKQLAQFLRDFLSRQPGVTAVPNISIVYISPSPEQAG